MAGQVPIALSRGSPPAALAATEVDAARHIFFGEEQGEIGIPLEHLLQGGELNIYQDVLRKNFFRIFLRGDRIVFQAAGYIGLIPINGVVAIEVRPKVPIQNLERLLTLAPRYTPEILEGRLRTFGTGEVAIPSLLDLLAYRLLDSINEIKVQGLHYEYQRVHHFDSAPKGKISPFDSARLQISTGRRLAVRSSSYERTFDTEPNRCIRLAINRLHTAYRSMRGRRGAREIAASLNVAESYFHGTALDRDANCLHSPIVHDPQLLPEGRSFYGPALAVAKLIIQNKGIAIRQPGSLSMPSILLNLEEVFEQYLRTMLSSYVGPRGFKIADGNLDEPVGAARLLFDYSDPPAKGMPRATPDIVITRPQDGSVPTELLIDAKYKLLKSLPDREDLNQVLAYSLRYGCPRVALAYPHRKESESHVSLVGRVSGVEIFKIAIDLGAADLQEEERRVAERLRDLLTTPPVRQAANSF